MFRTFRTATFLFAVCTVALLCIASARGQAPDAPAAKYAPEYKMRLLDETLAERNFTPDFTLSKEQKGRIHAIRGEWRAAKEKWEADSGLDRLVAERGKARAAKDDATYDRLGEQMKAIWARQPSADGYMQRIKAVLTAAQAEACKGFFAMFGV